MTRDQALAARDPLPVVDRPLYNPAEGYASYIVPSILVLILQQTLLIGIGLLGGTAREQGATPPIAGPLTVVLGRVKQGETNMFTGVMCGSYHDAWMELHEDLILTQGIDRSAEGSF